MQHQAVTFIGFEDSYEDSCAVLFGAPFDGNIVL